MSSNGRIDAEDLMEESACGDTAYCETDLNQAICDLSSTETQDLFLPAATCDYRQPCNIVTLDSISSSQNSFPINSYALSTENLRKHTVATDQQPQDTDFAADMKKLSLKLKNLPNPREDTTSSSNTSKSTSTILAGNMVEPPGVYRTANPQVSSRNSTIIAGRLLSCDSNDETNDSMDSPIEPSSSPFNAAIRELEDIQVITLTDENYTDSLENCEAKTVDMNKKKNTPLAQCKIIDTIVLGSDDEVQVVSDDMLETSSDNRVVESTSDPKSKILRRQKEKDSSNVDIECTVDGRKESSNFYDKVERILAESENSENVDPQLGTAKNRGEKSKPTVTSVETVLFPVMILPQVRKCGVEAVCEKERDCNINILSDQSRSTITSENYVEATCKEAEKMIYVNMKTSSMKPLQSINDCCASSSNVGVVRDTFSSIDVNRISTANPETPGCLQRGKITHIPTTNPATLENQLGQMNHDHIWSVLSKLDSSLSSPGRKGKKTPEKLFHRLSEEFKAAPSSFTERLLTIIEESAIQANRDPEDVELDSFAQCFRKSSNRIEDESMPEFAPSLCTYTSPATGIAGLTIQGLTIEEKDPEDLSMHNADNASQGCFGPQTPKTSILTPEICRQQISTPCSASGKTFTITPGFRRLAGSNRIYPRTPRRFFKSSSSDSPTPGSVGSPAGGRTPGCTGNDSTASFSHWEAWCEQMCSPGRGTPKKGVQDQSPMTNFRPSRLSELMTIYERQAFMEDSIGKEPEDVREEAYSVQNVAERSKNPNGSYHQVYTSVYEDELQKSLLAEVAEKKRRCFYTAQIMLEITDKPKVGLPKAPEGGARNDTIADADSGFLSTLSACTEYHTYISSKRNTLQTIIERSDQFSGGLRRAPVHSLDLITKRRDLPQKDKQILASTSSAGQNNGRKNPKDYRKNVASASMETLGKQSQPWYLRPGTSPSSSARGTLRSSNNSNAAGKSVGSEKTRVKTASKTETSANSKSPSRLLRSPKSKLNEIATSSAKTSQYSAKTYQPRRTVKRRSPSPRSPLRSKNPDRSLPLTSPTPLRKSHKKESSAFSTNVSHRRQQTRLATAVSACPIYNKTNTSSNNSPSSRLTERIENTHVPIVKVTSATPDKNTDDTDLTSYRDLQLPAAEERECGTPQSNVPKRKYFFTPGKSPTYGKVKQKPKRYFSPLQKTPSREQTPEGRGSQLQRVYRAHDSTRTVISPVAMYIKGTDAKLVKNMALSTNELMLTPTRKRVTVQKTATEGHSPILARSPQIAERSRLKFALSPPGGRCEQLSDEHDAEACENIASTHTGVGSTTAEDNFKLPRVSYKPASHVISLEKSSAVPQSQLMKGVLQSTAIRHAGRTKLAHIEKIVTTDNSATDSLQHDSADASLHVEFPVKKTNYTGTKKAA